MVLLERGAQAQPHFVAVYEVGRKLGQKTVPAASSGHLDALSWAPRCSAKRSFGLCGLLQHVGTPATRPAQRRAPGGASGPPN